jgi:transcriptional regulator with XRE-family HTH domain
VTGRPLSPIPASTPPKLRALVQRLRDAKEVSGKTFAALAKDSGVSERALGRYLGGEEVPRLETVKAITRACGRKEDEMVWAWYDAKAEKELPPAARNVGPERVASRAQLVESTIFMRIEGGYPPLHQLEKNAGRDENGETRLPHSTLHQVLHGQIPPHREAVHRLHGRFVHARRPQAALAGRPPPSLRRRPRAARLGTAAPRRT